MLVDLHPDLKRYMTTADNITQIGHPYTKILMYNPDLNALYNEEHNRKIYLIKDAKKKKSWKRFVFLHQHSSRLHAIHDISSELTDEEYWDLLGQVWADTNNIYKLGGLVPVMYGSHKDKRENIMLPQEKDFIESLPDEVVVYRGHQDNNKKGWSWTLSYFEACSHSTKLTKEYPKVIRGKIKKIDIIATITRKEEFECIIDPSKVIGARQFDAKKWQLENLSNQSNIHFSYHGLWHSWKVDYNVQQLCKLIKKADIEVCRYFAYFHDCRRQDEDKSPFHGERAAVFLDALYKEGKVDLTSDQMNKLLEAVRGHDTLVNSSDPTIGVCWDADRLDLTRVGIIPNPDFLSTKAAKGLIWKI